MIRASAAATRLIARLAARARRIAERRSRAARRTAHDMGAGWRSARALWPDLFEEAQDGK
ncbi:MAG: hypothetical protein ACK4E5_06420 [Erythrobacter cryptus]